MQRMSEVERGGAEAEFKGNMAAKSRPASADHKIIHASQRHPKPAWDFLAAARHSPRPREGAVELRLFRWI